MPLVWIGTDGVVLSANDQARALFGYDLAGRNYLTVLRDPAIVQCIETATATGKQAHTEYAMRSAANDDRFFVRANPVATQRSSGVLVSFEDQSKLEEADQMRSDFVANVSHELRTPLTALIGFIETLQGPASEDPKAQERFLTIMKQEAERMSRLIADLLSLSRLESEMRVRPRDPVDVKATIERVVSTLEPLARESGAKIEVQDATDIQSIPGDVDQIAQVLGNLIENALKYGGSQVEVSVGVKPHDEILRVPAIEILIRDDGAGIESHHIPRLTERFYRVDGHRSREVGGTGLGLAIVKHIVAY